MMNTPGDFKYKKFRAILISNSAPERYDIWTGKAELARFLVRNGVFYAYRAVNLTEPYHTTRTEGDAMFSAKEREPKLYAALDILESLIKEKRK